MSTNVSNKAFTTAAVLSALLVPGHIMLGFQTVYKGLDAAGKKPGGLNKEERAGLLSARIGWDAWNFLSIASALLNYQWSLTDGPEGPVNRSVAFVFAAANLLSAARYIAGKQTGPGVGILVTALASITGLTLQE